MKLKHWIKEYRFKKANQRQITPYQQRAAAEERITKRLLRIAAAQTAVLMRFHRANYHYPSGGLSCVPKNAKFGSQDNLRTKNGTQEIK